VFGSQSSSNIPQFVARASCRQQRGSGINKFCREAEPTHYCSLAHIFFNHLPPTRCRHPPRKSAAIAVPAHASRLFSLEAVLDQYSISFVLAAGDRSRPAFSGQSRRSRLTVVPCQSRPRPASTSDKNRVSRAASSSGFLPHIETPTSSLSVLPQDSPQLDIDGYHGDPPVSTPARLRSAARPPSRL
jgi:hypothetical protein